MTHSAKIRCASYTASALLAAAIFLFVMVINSLMPVELKAPANLLAVVFLVVALVVGAAARPLASLFVAGVVVILYHTTFEIHDVVGIDLYVWPSWCLGILWKRWRGQRRQRGPSPAL